MTILVIGNEHRAAIVAAMTIARQQPIPVAEGVEVVYGSTVTLEDKAKFPFIDKKHQAITIHIPRSFRLCISYEEQPAGLVLHLSISDDEAILPHPFAVDMILAACGEEYAVENAAMGWVEEFGDNGVIEGCAVNLLFFERPPTTEMH